MQATLTDAAKFDRLAARMGASSADAKDKLRKRMEPDAARVHQYATRTSVTTSPWGPGRMDALTMITDRVTITLPGIPENWSTGSAPVKPPFLWNAPQGLWTQWAGFQQDPISPQFWRDGGRVLPIDLTSKTPGRRAVPLERRDKRASTRREPFVAPGAPKLAGGCVRQD